MISGKLGELVAAHDRMTKIVWVALSGSLLMYAAIPFLMSSGWEPSDGSSTPLLPILAGVALVVAAASIVYGRREFSDDRLTGLLREPVSAEGIAGQLQTSALRDTLLADLQAMPAEDLRAYSVVMSRQAPAIIRLALQEAVGIVGLAAAFIDQDPMLVVPFVGAALLLQMRAFPNTTALAERVRKLGLTVPMMG
jgi:hypothetical protein